MSDAPTSDPPGGRLTGKRVVITGGARGIGFAIAQRFVGEGASVVIGDRDGSGGREAAAALAAGAVNGAEVFDVETDIADVAQIDRLMAATVDRLGGLDVLVNNAAYARFGFALDFTEEDWDDTQTVTLRGSFFCAQRAARVMAAAGGGVIINMSSMTVQLAHTRNVAYTTAKAGIEAITRQLSVELAEYGIQVNALAPGPVETEFSRKAITPEGRAIRLTRMPGGRFGQPEEVAEAALFLAAPGTEWMTGAILAIDGGYTATGVIELRGAGPSGDAPPHS
jgi:3-oxoacyl-[acyl-carrier protein] reductase